VNYEVLNCGGNR